METFCFALHSLLVRGGNDYKTDFVYQKTSLVDSLLCNCPCSVHLLENFCWLNILKHFLGKLRSKFIHRVHTEWQKPLFGVHFIMMEKSTQPGEGG